MRYNVLHGDTEREYFFRDGASMEVSTRSYRPMVQTSGTASLAVVCLNLDCLQLHDLIISAVSGCVGLFTRKSELTLSSTSPSKRTSRRTCGHVRREVMC